MAMPSLSTTEILGRVHGIVKGYDSKAYQRQQDETGAWPDTKTNRRSFVTLKTTFLAV